MKLTIGMAVYDDFAGIWFTINALRVYHATAMKECELLVVDNHPGSEQGQALKRWVEGWVAPTQAARYIPFPDPPGPALAKDQVFRQARGAAVLCMDSHVLLGSNAVQRLIDYYDANPTTTDLHHGPMVLDSFGSVQTHLDPRWRGVDLGTWGFAWRCPCGAMRFSVIDHQPGPTAHPENRYRMLLQQTQPTPTLRCAKCGFELPAMSWIQHEGRLIALGCQPVGLGPDDPPFDIPGHGCGLFSCRREAWLGFNPHFRDFGGEEYYLAEKYRQAGYKSRLLPFLRWHHLFKDNKAPYPLSLYSKVRNYVLGHQELGLPLDEIKTVFVQPGLMCEGDWAYLLAGPISRTAKPGGCGSPPVLPDSFTLDDLCKSVEAEPGDLNQHVPMMREWAAKSRRCVELTIRHNGTVAMLAAQPARLVSHNTSSHSALAACHARKGKTKFLLDNLPPDQAVPEECDLLFIDLAVPTAEQFWAALERHGLLASRILLHDTVLFAERFVDGKPGLLPAIRRWVKEHPEYSVVFHTALQQGMTVLSRLDEDKPKLPSLPRMAFNYAKAIAKHVATGSRLANEETVQARLDICLPCPHRIENRCSGCGCFLFDAPNDAETKPMWADSFCPFGFWNAQAKEGQP